MSKAFLSHSSANKDLVGKIAAKLGKDNCIYDEVSFEATEKTVNEIFSGLQESDIFILFISEPALQSKWVKKEIIGAKKMIDKGLIARMFPLIIDPHISYSDSRIPEWIKKPYNIKTFDNEVLILKKIKQLLREANFRKFSHLKNLHELFIGRHKQFEELERRMFGTKGILPSCIVAYNFFEGIGRRSFLRNGLVRNQIIDKWYDPIYIPLNSKESIEDFIYKLNFIEPTKEIFDADIAGLEYEAKIQFARQLVTKFAKNGELIFIIDDGGVVLHNKELVTWFAELLNTPEFENQIVLCLISKFKPNPIRLRKMDNIISIQIDELSASEVKTLFNRYLNYLDIQISPEDSAHFLGHLNGIPGQVIYAANLIESVGVQQAKLYIEDIDEYDHLSVLAVVNFLENDHLCLQMLIAISKFPIISHDLVYKIFGESKEVYVAIQKLFDLGLFYATSSTHQYLKLNNSISDYMARSRMELEENYNLKLRELIKESISKPLDLNEESDYSEFLFSIGNMIRANQEIPSKYFIPSFILAAIVKEYDDRHYEDTITLAQKLLESKRKFDPQVVRETKFWLCQAFCKTGNDKFFEEVQYFNKPDQYEQRDYFFLLGFFFRNKDNMNKAEEYFNKVLAIDPENSKANSELVKVYLRKEEFGLALKLSRANFERRRENIYYINDYFASLIRKAFHNPEELEILNDLLGRAKRSLNKKAEEFYSAMMGEFIYYVRGNTEEAINFLLDILRINNSSYHIYKTLIKIYKREDRNEEIHLLADIFPDLDRF